MNYQKSEIQQIQKKLVRFGLNPSEWKICPVTRTSTNQIIIQNKSDSSFQFLGRLKKGMSLEVDNLQILTI